MDDEERGRRRREGDDEEDEDKPGLEKAGRHGDGMEKRSGESVRQEEPGGRLEKAGEETTRRAGEVPGSELRPTGRPRRQRGSSAGGPRPPSPRYGAYSCHRDGILWIPFGGCRPILTWRGRRQSST